jgi:hypothetical protein
MTDYKATPEQWAVIEKAQAPVEVAPGTFVAGKDHVLSVIILELRARVEALEANAKPTPNQLPLRSLLVERMAETLHAVTGTEPGEPPELWKPEARAAIREVAEWLRDQSPVMHRSSRHWAEVLEQEAER